MTFLSLPVTAVDVIGSILMICLSIACVIQVKHLREREPTNVIWTYLFWVCMALTGFAVSRSAGHLIKQVLIFSSNESMWELIRPYSGAVNTIMFVVVGAVTLYFERSWSIYEQILTDQESLENAHGELIYLNRNLEDLVAERTRALSLSEHNYHRIFEISRDMIAVTQKDGTVMEINPAGLNMMGFSEKDVPEGRMNIKDFFADHNDWKNLRAKLNTMGFTSNEEINLKTVDGTLRRTLLSSGLDEADGTGPAALHFMIRDMENRRLMEEQIAQADKLASIGQLSSGIAHEINNPLGIILGYTQLLLRHESPETDQYSDLKTIEKQVRTCKSIVEDLLNFARSSKPSKDRVLLNDSIEDIISFIEHHSKLGDVVLIKDYDTSIPSMVLDEKKIKQVFMNLIMNSIHAVGKKGRITVSTRYDSNKKQVKVSVEDTGYGIEKKNLKRIFDPFFTTKSFGEGTGLGLSVSYGIVKSHEGDIRVESAPGKGSTFTVILPVSIHSDSGKKEK